jgi:uncharacterized delta-60 repeat protein
MMRPWLAGLAVAVALALPAPAAAAVGPFDPAFGRGGKLGIAIGEGPALAAMARDPSGGVVLAGSANPAAGEYALIRIGDTGSVDTLFGNWKPNSNRFFADRTYLPAALAPRPGGGWVTAGSEDLVSSAFAVVSHRADGSLDPSFGSGGIVRIDLGATPAAAGAVAPQPDGRLLVGGWVQRPSGRRLVAVRLTPSGSLDPSWGSGGIVEIAPPGSTECEDETGPPGVRALLRMTDEKVVVVGSLPLDGRPRPVLARLRPDGRPDPTFGMNGVTVLSPLGGRATVAGAVVLRGIVLVGLTLGDRCDQGGTALPTRFGAMSIAADGKPHPLYGRTGARIIGFPVSARAFAVTLLHLNRLVIAGGDGNGYVVVARLTENGRLDRGFGGGRTCAEVNGGDLTGPATSVLRLAGSRVLVGGASSSDAGSLQLIRYRASFTPGGVECFAITGVTSSRQLRSVRLRAILGRRGRLRLRVRRGGYGSRGRFATACLGTRGPGDVSLRWDGRVGGRTLRPGPYSLVLESRDARGRLLGRSYLKAVQLTRRASGPRGPRC